MHVPPEASDQCIATYPGNSAQALFALDVIVEIIAGLVSGAFCVFLAPQGGPEIPRRSTTLANEELKS